MPSLWRPVEYSRELNPANDYPSVFIPFTRADLGLALREMEYILGELVSTRPFG